MKPTSLIMTIIGKDKPGLVEWISGLVADHDANWLESRMARLAGQFAGILHVEVQESQRAGLEQALNELEARGLHVTISASATTTINTQEKLARLSLVGHDRPGIVRQISRVFAQLGVNVEELETST